MAPASDEELLRELLEAFLPEASELLRSLNEHLLALEGAGPGEADPLLEQVFRDAHTLKGAAAAVNLASVRSLAHGLETAFARMQRGELPRSPATFDIAYQAVDAMGTLVERAAAGTAEGVDATSLLARLESAGTEPPGTDGAGTEDAGDGGGGTGMAPSPPRRGDGPGSARHAGEPALSPEGAPPRAREETVRVSTSKLDALMGRVGELVTAGAASDQYLAELRSLADELSRWEALWRRARPGLRRATGRRGRLADGGAAAGTDRRDAEAMASFFDAGEARLAAVRSALDGLVRDFVAGARRVAQATAGVQAEVRSARMLPLSTVLDTFRRMVRDLARERRKEVTLVLGGEDTELDRAVIEQIKSPLTHLLRNAVDHGVESPERRLRAGKPRAGRVAVTASQRGATVFVEVSDDGAGIDAERVREAAARKGLLGAEEAALLGEREAVGLIFRSGLSTSPAVTDLSGRGVGLDAVRESVERLSGTIEVSSRPGEGTSFLLGLPLTVSTTRCLLVQAGGQTFAIPVTNVLRLVRVGPEDVEHADGGEAVRVGGEPLPLVRLARLLGTAAGPEDGRRLPAVVVVAGSAERRAALLVAGLAGVREVVVKALPAPLPRVRHAAGAAVLGTGEVVVVLNPADLLERDRAAPLAARGERRPGPEQAVVLIADDSITTRTLERNIMQAAGYRVRVAADGVEAWTLLQAEGADLVVSDVRMPRMDGLELTRRIRTDERFRQLPVVLVTSLESPADRERGIEAGADAYVVKSSFDQEQLLETVRRLI